MLKYKQSKIKPISPNVPESGVIMTSQHWHYYQINDSGWPNKASSEYVTGAYACWATRGCLRYWNRNAANSQCQGMGIDYGRSLFVNMFCFHRLATINYEKGKLGSTNFQHIKALITSFPKDHLHRDSGAHSQRAVQISVFTRSIRLLIISQINFQFSSFKFRSC